MDKIKEQEQCIERSISKEELLGLTEDSEIAELHLLNAVIKYRDFLMKIGPIDEIDFHASFSIVENNKEKKIGILPTSFFVMLADNLNMELSLEQAEFIQEAQIRQRIQKLRVVTREQDLAIDYQNIHEKYKEVKDYCTKFQEIKSNINNPKLSISEKIKWQIKLMNHYEQNEIKYSIARKLDRKADFSIQDFCRIYSDTFETLLNNKESIFNYLSANSIDASKLSISEETLESYLVTQTPNEKRKEQYS